MIPITLPFQPSPTVSVIVMVRMEEPSVGQSPSGQKTPKVVVAVNVEFGFLVSKVVPFGAVITNPT